jgi:hypothetical protein
MIRRLAFAAVFLATISTVYPQVQLPETDDYESFEVEPPILMPNRQLDSAQSVSNSAASGHDPADLEKKLERAKRTAIDAEQLFKRGVLSKVEVELRALRIVRLQADLENARFQRAVADLVVQRTRLEMGEISKEQLAASEKQVQIAGQTAQVAAAAREKAEIAAAEANLRRQQKLFELGSARKSDLARAEQKLAEIKAGKN